ncbi:hypothetical protein EDI_237490 [Entamoeba dispar SAW760]|uniref:Uncharacterized protein n=1 Tax=Entamoeba dispar (strain ATCC PRA-260 / SAW760) TaxID=370354 RepID=B0EP91_ENTDS|nr:uncharacterized protein EDI_237490 [Entamoeba dispar SAW760]EDR23662.1 hypothetical protein EDI_237490 [Entamoeba dispar SAW760]|eukprot:EDR23662.1 hypothetical protein EDI_237490 [Entamoeba dispar SAW760]
MQFTSQLPKVFLSEVVHYLKSLENVYTFTLVNKKCKSAVENLTCNPGFCRGSEITSAEEQSTFIKEVQLFPRLSTIKISNFSSFLLRYNPHHIQQIMFLTEIDSTQIQFIGNLKEKITVLSLFVYDDIVDLSQFKNLQRVSLRVHLNHSSLVEFFPNTNQHLQFVRVKFQYYVDEEFINSLPLYLFDKTVLEFDTKDRLEYIISSVPSIFSRSTIVYTAYYTGIDERVMIRNRVWEFSQEDVHQLEYLPEEIINCHWFGENYEEYSNDMNLNGLYKALKNYLPYFLINGNGNIQKLQCLTNVKCFTPIQLPQSVTSLDITINIPQQFDLDEFDSLKVLRITFQNANQISVIPKRVVSYEQNGGIVQLNNLVDVEWMKLQNISSISLDNRCYELTHLEVINSTFISPMSTVSSLKELVLKQTQYQYDRSIFYPTTLTFLSCDFNEYHPLPLIHSLHLRFNKNNSYYVDISQHPSIQSLTLEECVKSTVLFPSNLSSITLNNCFLKQNITLSHLLNLQEVTISSQNLSILLPTSIRKLTLDCSLNLSIPNIHCLTLLSTFVLNKCYFNFYQLPKSIRHLYIDNSLNVTDDILSLFPKLQNIEYVHTQYSSVFWGN